MNPFLNLTDQTIVAFYITDDNKLTLDFSYYKLAIYNPYNLINCSNVSTLISRKVFKINIVENIQFELLFEEDMKLIVKIDDSSYSGPEAMQLLGPNNLIAIWQ